MRAYLVKYWEAMRASYWFIPSLMAVSSVALAFVFVAIDKRIGPGFLDNVDILSESKPEGARDVLSTIAGSMITVAGVTFSITIAAVAYAAQQFGPRLLTNFMRDRGNQVTLGTFIATFLYCLLVLRTIRGMDEPLNGDFESAGAFVPHLAIIVAMLFAVASIGVFIYFIHHVPESIHAATVTSDIGKELSKKIDDVFPEMIGAGRGSADVYIPKWDLPNDFFSRSLPVIASGSGYLQYIADKDLVEIAKRRDVVVRLQFAPGDFIQKGKTLALVYPADNLDDADEGKIRDTFAWGRKRTQVQDIMFLTDELIEIAARALSPGINDPFTANTCMDWLGAAMSRMARRDDPSPFRFDDDRTLRVIVRPISFEYFIDQILDRMRPYMTADELTANHALAIIAQVLVEADSEEDRERLASHALAFRDASLANFEQPRIRAQIEERYRVIMQVVRNPQESRQISDQHRWFQGSA
jgi:uncharacterized membrane protein